MKKLKYIVNILDEYRKPVAADKRNQNAEVLYPYYGASGKIDLIDGYTIDNHVMLIGEDGANLRMRNLPLMYEVNGKAWINNHAHILKPKEGYDFDFLFLALESLDINLYITGSAQPKLSQENLKEIMVPVTSYNKQKKISKYLKDRCIELDILTSDIQKQIDTLEQYKKSVITETVTKGLNPDAEMKDSKTDWCPRIPVNWEVVNPKIMFALRTERARKEDEQLTASQEYGIVNQNKYMEITGTRVVTVEKDFSILKHVEPNDFVISMRSFQGGLEFSEIRGCISSAYVMLIPDERYVYPPFYRWFFKSSKYINALQSTSNLVRDGQAMRYANFIQVPLFLIPIEEQMEISNYLNERCSEIDTIISDKKKQLEVIAEYKKSLIYEYVTGKKEVM